MMRMQPVFLRHTLSRLNSTSSTFLPGANPVRLETRKYGYRPRWWARRTRHSAHMAVLRPTRQFFQRRAIPGHLAATLFDQKLGQGDHIPGFAAVKADGLDRIGKLCFPSATIFSGVSTVLNNGSVAL